MQNLGEIGWVVQERKLKMFKIYMTDELHTMNDIIVNDYNDDNDNESQRTSFDLKSLLCLLAKVSYLKKSWIQN